MKRNRDSQQGRAITRTRSREPRSPVRESQRRGSSTRWPVHCRPRAPSRRPRARRAPKRRLLVRARSTPRGPQRLPAPPCSTSSEPCGQRGCLASGSRWLGRRGELGSPRCSTSWTTSPTRPFVLQSKWPRAQRRSPAAASCCGRRPRDRPRRGSWRRTASLARDAESVVAAALGFMHARLLLDMGPHPRAALEPADGMIVLPYLASRRPSGSCPTRSRSLGRRGAPGSGSTRGPSPCGSPTAR